MSTIQKDTIMAVNDKGKKEEYLSGRLLLAMPQMGDPRFHRAVIFMCAHDENGAMGLVINHLVPGLDMRQLLRQMNIEMNTDAPSLPVMSGGPVEAGRGFILHSSEFLQKDTVKICDGFSVTGTVEALKAIAAGEGPDDMLFILGYAGWGAGQLDREIQQNAWLVADPDHELIFELATDEKWSRAIHKLGIRPEMLSDVAGRA